MNKLAPLALTILLIFGGALWYLANLSLNEHVRARVIQVGEYYSNNEVSVASANLNLSAGRGVINGFAINNNGDYQNEFAVKIEQITFTFDPKIINQKVITIEEIVLKNTLLIIEHSQKNDSSTETLNNIDLIIHAINNKMAQIHDSRKQKAEPYIRVKQVTLINSTLINNNNKKVVTAHLSLGAIGNEDGLPESLFGAEVIRKSIAALVE